MHVMKSTSTSWRWTIWIACFAVLLNALAPSISHAMKTGIPATWEICRGGAGDATSVPGNADLVVVGMKKAPQESAAAMADCSYCLPHGGSVALMPSAASGLGLMGGHALRPFLFYHAPQPLLALSAAPPRGPPAILIPS
jgi:hypothetical protein